MKVAMIIVNYNDSEDILEYVGKIREYKTIDRIIIVDNKSSKEGELEALKTLENDKVKVIESDKNGGYAYGNNFGISYLEKDQDISSEHNSANKDTAESKPFKLFTLKVTVPPRIE